MPSLIAGLVLFFGLHSISIVAPRARDRWAQQYGEPGWKGIFALVSLASFALIVNGFAAARHTSALLYAPPGWLRPVALLLMLPVFPLLFAAYLPGRIRTTVKHPLLAATKTWALAHLLVNGSLADVLLFGAFLVWAVADRISLKRRAAPRVPGAPPGRWNDAIAVVAGLALYAATIGGLHRWLFGVAPLG
jgi:uncharacterized membrane protein